MQDNFTQELCNKLIDYYEGAIREIKEKEMDYWGARDYCKEKKINLGICCCCTLVFNKWIYGSNLVLQGREPNNGYWCKPPISTDTIEELLQALQTRVDIMKSIEFPEQVIKTEQ